MGRRRIRVPSWRVWITVAYYNRPTPLPSMTCRTQRRVSDAGDRASSLVHRHVVACALAGVDLARPRDLLLRVVDHLEPLGDPAAPPPDREQHRGQVDGHAPRPLEGAGGEREGG